MANGRNQLVAQHLRRVLSTTAGSQRTDKQLLQAFVLGDEAAFETLVRRHGPLVLGVCRRVLRNAADADDAFQATFLVLARKAASNGWHSAIGAWLYQVAYRVALKMRARRSRQHPQPPAPRLTTQLVNEMTLGELRLALDEELQRLPERYRAPLLLCYLQGKTQDEAARELGWSEGALRGCLFRGREILRQRLARRGLTVSAVLLASALSQSLAEAAIPATLLGSSVAAAVPFAAGQALVAGLASPTTLALSKEVLSAMFLAKVKIAALVVLTLGAIGATGVVLQPALADADAVLLAANNGQERAVQRDAPREGGERPAAERRDVRAGRLIGVVAKVDTTKKPHSITLRIGDGALVAFDLANDAQYTVAGKAADLAKLKEGARVSVQLGDDNRTVSAIQAEARLAYGAVSAVDAGKKTVTVTRLLDGGGVGPASTYELANEVDITVDRAPAKLPELADCRMARLELDADDKVIRIYAEWASRDDVRARIKAVDAANNQLTVTLSAGRDEREEGGVKLIGRDMVYTLTADAKIHLSGQLIKLADLKVGQDVIIRAEGNDKAKAIRAVNPPALRDGERREGERPRDGGVRREGEKPRDGERREGDKPRDGERREGEKPRDGR